MRRRIVVVLCFLGLTAGADMAEVGQPFPAYTLTDAHGITNQFKASTRHVIVVSEKALAEKMNSWLAGKGSNYLADARAEYVSDITPMPALVASMFALPKMKKLPFRILLARSEAFARTYPRKDGKVAVFTLDDEQVLRSITWAATAPEVGSILSDGAPAASEPRQVPGR